VSILEDLSDIDLVIKRKEFQEMVDAGDMVFPQVMAQMTLDRILKEMERRVKK